MGTKVGALTSRFTPHKNLAAAEAALFLLTLLKAYIMLAQT
jgi:hypothetical protein